MSQVNLTIGGETFALKCTLDAFRTIPAALGGFVGAFNAMQTADVNTIVFVIAAGIGKASSAKEHDRIAELIFKDGLEPETISKVSEYVLLLKDGGKVKSEAQSDAAGE